MHKTQNYIFLIILLFISCDLRTAEDYYDLAYILEEQGKYNEAIKMLDKAIKKKPDLKPALLNRGADKSLLKNYKGAIADYLKILQYDSDNTLVLMNIGNNYKRLDEDNKAIKFYNKALKTKGALKSDSIYGILRLNNEWENDSDYYVKQYEILYERAIAYVNTNQHELAIIDFEKAIKYNYEKASALNWVGESYLKLNDTINAMKYLNKAVKFGIIDPKESLKKLE